MLRVAFPLPALWEIVPAGVLIASLFGAVRPAAGAWAAIAYAASTCSWVAIHSVLRAPLWHALLHPLAAIALSGILARAAWRGDRVEWKGRVYVSR